MIQFLNALSSGQHRMPTPLAQKTSILGDALEALKVLPDNSFDLCIADPPYNMSKKKGLKWAFSSHVTMQESWDIFTEESFFEFNQKWISEVLRLLKPNGNFFVFGTYHNIYQMGFLLQQLDLKILNSIIWLKPNAQPNITCRMLTESTEQIIWCANNSQKKASKWTFNYDLAKSMNEGKQMRNLWSFPVTPRRERVAAHPTQKPLALIERIVQLGSNIGDKVLDPFAGVGTTGVAAEKHGRNFCLVEKHPPFFNAQRGRFEHPQEIEFAIAPPLGAEENSEIAAQA